MKLDLSFWRNASSKRKRIYSIILIFILTVIVSIIGSFIPLTTQDAQTISNSANQTLNTHKANGIASFTEYIFLNNFSICLLMFVPVIGPILGFLMLFDTGIATGAIASVQGFSPLLAFVILIITPVFWLEFASYSIGITESIWLFRRLLQGRWRELKNTGILIGICAIFLLIGAIVEVWLISLAG